MTAPEQRPHPVTGVAFASPVPPGTGWPDDPAEPDTPVAHDAAEVERLAATAPDLGELTARQSVCRACPRLVEWREEVAASPRRSFAGEPYWGRPVAGWGDPAPAILVVGLAPAAHGGNRTGRIFTGDRSGDWLFAALARVGLAVQPTSVSAGDGQRLLGVRVVAAVRCAPPANKPLPAERDACFPWLRREWELCAPTVRSVVALGSYGWTAAVGTLAALGYRIPRPRPRFGHGAEVPLAAPDEAPAERPEVLLVGSYHPSQQNTFTGKLTEPMLDAVLTRAADHAGLPAH
ncbi:uracil-DNA glycosylase, family 4 [Actinopolymorpha cephalotaxi]|uniref:Type-5 uracil-DNA glycosylase n=1 Tax=Actinopolymorpha cephalotaxi TaxID=504797 RepID=A0A1I2M6C2_9ACTN|nr:uracil-DNA glycosylase [Actinopolymorpha cephalotaxi]NYH81609.1 uracil-DNA glycosylase family 4 [Actinopolymorpha cephalotaxi]SFF87022.1 uracil-DNA glycosylase, family 4 [Actinopolymorpha cephalotaxi]